jgi:CheY-like chemotaxis protein
VAKRTLIVSPDPGLVQQTRGVLEARGVIVDSVATAQAARDASQLKPADLVIAEVDLPGGSGYDLCRFLKSSGHAPKVMLLYTAGEGSAERNASECGADVSVRRPFLTSQFLERLVPMVGPGFFGVHPVADMADSIPGEQFDSGSLDPLNTGDVQALGPQTQELPPLNIEPFDENNPVSVPVGPDATAHAVPVVTGSQESVDLEDSLDSFDSPNSLDPVPDPFGTERVSALGRHTGAITPVPEDSSVPSAASIRDAARVRRAVDAHIDELLEPGGRLAALLEQTVTRAVAEALAQAIPAATEAAARILAGSNDD